MATKYLLMDEAAARLGITTEELNDRRSRAEISGFRDGKSWKFRESDVEALSAKIQSGSGSSEEEYSLDLGLDDFNEPVTPAKGASPSSGDDFGLDLGLDEDLPAAPAHTPPKFPAASQDSAGADDDLMLSLDDDMEITLGDDLPPPAPAAKSSPPSAGKGSQSPADDDLSLSLDDDIGLSDFPPSPAAKASSPQYGIDDDDLKLSLDDDDLELPPAATSPSVVDSSGDFELKLDDEASGEIGSSSGLPSLVDDEIELADVPVSAIKSSPPDAPPKFDDALALDDDEGMTLASGDSGVSLLDDAGSAELVLDDVPSAADALSDDLNENELLVSDSADASGMADSDFQLTPFDDIDADLSDSGSQVIQLDDSQASNLGDSGQIALDEADEPDFGEEESSPVVGAAPAAAAAAAVATTAPLTMAGPEARFDTLDMLMLGGGSGVLLLVGFMMMDLVRNLGTWNGASGVSSMLLDSLAGMLGLK